MSMLAEKKRKQKWSLNPRGNDWVQDSNKFGQKMLEKMGWQHGRGLGAKENGITEHIKVSYKNDSKGMGYKESSDQWTEHETNFSALLESLTGEKTVEVKLNSLEKKSQTSRARVHYHKFTRGKDLSRYSEKDLANIFGKKSLKEPPKVEEKEVKIDEKERDKESESKFLFNAGSMRDYFKNKLSSFGKSNGYVVGYNGVLKREETDSESDVRPSFKTNNDKLEEESSHVGFGFKSGVIPEKNDNLKFSNGKASFVSYVNDNSNEEKCEKKKRKAAENEINEVSSPMKKLKKNKETSKQSTENGKAFSNPAFNPLPTPVKIQRHVLDTIEESASEDLSDQEETSECVVTEVQVHENSSKNTKHFSESNGSNTDMEECDSIKKRKKKAKKIKEVQNGFENCIEVENIDLTLNDSKEDEVEVSYEVKRKKNKKKNKIIEEIRANKSSKEGFMECDIKAKKLKKTNQIVENGSIDLTIDSVESKSTFENPNFNGTDEETSVSLNVEDNPYEVKVKPKKKKKKNESIDLTTEDSSVSSLSEGSSKTKKKKKDKNFAVENPNFELEDSLNVVVVEENPYEVKVNKKKTKRRLGFNGMNSEESRDDSTELQNEENPYEVKIKPKKKKKKRKEDENYAVENPNFNESLEESASIEVEENPYEIKPKKKKKKKSELAIDNPNFNPNDSIEISNANVLGEIEINKKKSKEKEADIAEIQEDISLNVEESDLMLNIVTTPIISKTRTVNEETTYSATKLNSAKRRKSVRFSDVTQERIIPNNDELRDIENRNELFEINTQVINNSLEEQNISFDMSSLDKVSYDVDGNEKQGKKRKLGLDNVAFDKHKTNLEENLDSISKTIDRYEAEIDNDINEKKLEALEIEDFMVGEVGNPHGENEKLPEGTRLKFKYASFESKSPFYQMDKTGSKKSYKHLIKGDIVVGFKNTNLHEIRGYAVKKVQVNL